MSLPVISKGHVASTRSAMGCAALLAAIAAIAVSPATASAAGRQSARQVAAKPKPEPVPEGPLTIVVSIRDQRLTLYSGTDQVSRVPISTGTRGHETPTGIFSVIQKARMHYSNLYNSAPMPFMQRLTWSGIALHAGYLPGYPASHGCVRMPPDFARRLYGMTSPGVRVIVTHGDAAPVPLSHPRLAALAPAAAGAPIGVAQVAVAQAGTAVRPEPPMHLGASIGSDVTSTAADAAAPLSDKPGKSLLKRAQLAVAERTLAIEAARAARQAAAERLEEALQTVRQAREAHLAGRSEVAKARSRVQRSAAELAGVEARLEAMSRRPSGIDEAVAAATEDRFEESLRSVAGQLEAARSESDDKDETLREISDELALAERARAGASLASEDAAFRVKLAEEALKEARRDLGRRQQPVSLFVSRKTGQLYVRQGFEPLLEAQVSIDDPDAPVGTHVFTVQAAAAAGQPLRWSVVTVPAATSLQPERASVRRATAGSVRERSPELSAAAAPVTASAALDRLQLPAEVIEQLADLFKPGSSLIVSDLPLSRETGKATDLIVQSR